MNNITSFIKRHENHLWAVGTLLYMVFAAYYLGTDNIVGLITIVMLEVTFILIVFLVHFKVYISNHKIKQYLG